MKDSNSSEDKTGKADTKTSILKRLFPEVPDRVMVIGSTVAAIAVGTAVVGLSMLGLFNFWVLWVLFFIVLLVILGYICQRKRIKPGGQLIHLVLVAIAFAVPMLIIELLYTADVEGSLVRGSYAYFLVYIEDTELFGSIWNLAVYTIGPPLALWVGVACYVRLMSSPGRLWLIVICYLSIAMASFLLVGYAGFSYGEACELCIA